MVGEKAVITSCDGVLIYRLVTLCGTVLTVQVSKMLQVLSSGGLPFLLKPLSGRAGRNNEKFLPSPVRVHGLCRVDSNQRQLRRPEPA